MGNCWLAGRYSCGDCTFLPDCLAGQLAGVLAGWPGEGQRGSIGGLMVLDSYFKSAGRLQVEIL